MNKLMLALAAVFGFFLLGAIAAKAEPQIKFADWHVCKCHIPKETVTNVAFCGSHKCTSSSPTALAAACRAFPKISSARRCETTRIKVFFKKGPAHLSLRTGTDIYISVSGPAGVIALGGS